MEKIAHTVRESTHDASAYAVCVGQLTLSRTLLHLLLDRRWQVISRFAQLSSTERDSASIVPGEELHGQSNAREEITMVH